MKKHSLTSLASLTPKPSVWIAPPLLAAIGCAVWVHAQTHASNRGLPDQEGLLRELERSAFFDPVGFAAEMEKLKTPADREAEARARLSITDPAAYGALYAPMDAAQRAAHEKAVFEFTHPLEAAAELEEKRKDEAYRQAEADALNAIRNPAPATAN